MSTAVKVWGAGEKKPEGLFNKDSCPLAPQNWFKEEPAYAAELYALERNLEGEVHVIDDEGTKWTFEASFYTGVNVTEVYRRDGRLK